VRLQHAGASETAVKSVLVFTCGYWLPAVRYNLVFHNHKLPHGA